MNCRRSKLERNNSKETERAVLPNPEENDAQSAELETKMAMIKGMQSNDKPEESKEEDDEPKDNQYEFIMNVLNPYKKIIYKLIQLGYIRERTKF